MKDKRYMLNTLLAVILGVALAVCVLLKTWIPAVVLPKPDIPNLAALSLLALVLDHYLAGRGKRCYVCVAVFSVLTFGLLPWAAGMGSWTTLWKTALLGGAVFTALTFLFTSIQDRLSSGPTAKAAPILSAFGLYLAVQCFAGIVL